MGIYYINSNNTPQTLQMGATGIPPGGGSAYNTTGSPTWLNDKDGYPGGFAVPSTYSVKGRQYVVISSSGHWTRAPSVSKIVAFTLPEK